MRYIWDLEPQYRREAGWLGRQAMRVWGPRLRQWDVTTAARVDHFVANSRFVARRIEKYYRRQASVIHPPVDLGRFGIGREVGDAYLCAGQITPYKKVEVAVEAFSRNGRPLVVIGDGAAARLRAAAGPNVRFLGAVDDATMAAWFARCRALVYPGVEDFGIVPLEAMASGRPVIAYGRGGATETVVDGVTGVLFDEQTPEALTRAVERFEAMERSFDAAVIRGHAERFGGDRFIEELRRFISGCLAPNRGTVAPLRVAEELRTGT
jgi:glycosyltransferase involved in cell wall biosynthesis